jgi:ubiquinone/menaquinone biosynthesis C-methylase UbiE
LAGFCVKTLAAVSAKQFTEKINNLYFRWVSNNYDSIARYYDFVHRLFYGQSEINAQSELLDYIRPGDRILIVGGGTGWILEKLSAVYPSGLDITYIESSGKMMELSKKRDYRRNNVSFVQSPVEEWVGDGLYDCILTGLFFDNFTAAHSAQIVQQLTPFLKRDGFWLDSDFYYPKGRGKLWQAILLKSMYVSARLICGVEAKRLPDMELIFTTAGYRLEYVSFHYQRFIRSVVYQRKMG